MSPCTCRLGDGFDDVPPLAPTDGPPGAFQDTATGNSMPNQAYATTTPFLLPRNLSSVPILDKLHALPLQRHTICCQTGFTQYLQYDTIQAGTDCRLCAPNLHSIRQLLISNVCLTLPFPAVGTRCQFHAPGRHSQQSVQRAIYPNVPVWSSEQLSALH